jgi:glycine cleavage system aminomethyltransferase T
VIVSRLNSSQASIWRFSETTPAWSDLSCSTEMTDAYALMALIGRETKGIIEKVSALDLTPPDKKPPFILLGQVLQIPMQLVLMDGEKRPSGILLACSRGYAQCVVRALLDAGSEFGLKPAGEKRFVDWMRNLLTV